MSTPIETPASTPKRGLGWLIGGALIVVLALIAAALWYFSKPEADSRIAEPPSKEEVAEMDIKPLEGDLRIESVGLGMPLEEMSIVDNVINPPGFDSAYIVRDYAQPGDTEHMSVIALHSLGGGDVPGNKLIDVENATATVKPGDTVDVQGNEYEVTSTFAQGKEAAAADDGLWEDKPGKLLIWTCLQKPDGSASTENVIIEAKLIG